MKVYNMNALVIVLSIILSYKAIAQENKTNNISNEITTFSILVHEYEDAIGFYTKKLGFKVIKDFKYGKDKRWVSLSLSDTNIKITFAKVFEKNKYLVGNQAGEYPIFIISTNDIEKVYSQLKTKGVKFIKEPATQAWGKSALLVDLYGNKIHLQEVKR